LPAHTPLRTVRERFRSHGSSLAKDTSVVRVPRRDGKRGVMRTHPNHIGQLGNTGLRPFTLRSIGRQLQDAPSDWHRSSFAFPGLRRFHRLSCHSRPDRRGRIRHVTYRHWFLRSSQCCLRSPCLAVGVATNGVAQRLQRFHVLHSIREKLGPLCYTGSPESARRATLDDPDSTACHFGPSLNQPRMARFS
jgi:hypothetical protein